jgi:high-affinity nickel-transport protein
VLAFIGLLHVAGWGALLVLVLHPHPGADGAAFGIGVGLTAYLLGVRHAFDADHIAAIDNTTRKLIHEGQRPASVGFWFACGHSSVVFVLASIVAFGSRVASERVLDDATVRGVARTVGTLVSGGFLYAIAALNAAALLEIWRAFRRIRAGCDETALPDGLEPRGIVSRLLRPVMKLVARPWQMFLVGLLFGLGFDTASEIALLVSTSSSAAAGLPWQAVLCLPVLFAAGMSLFDTLDGFFMTAAYGWALAAPLRRISYNLVVTASPSPSRSPSVRSK